MIVIPKHSLKKEKNLLVLGYFCITVTLSDIKVNIEISQILFWYPAIWGYFIDPSLKR